MVGKKVFFVQPHSVVQQQLMAELIENEYEVLVDSGFGEEGWEAFIQSVQSNPALARKYLVNCDDTARVNLKTGSTTSERTPSNLFAAMSSGLD